MQKSLPFVNLSFFLRIAPKGYGKKTMLVQNAGKPIPALGASGVFISALTSQPHLAL